MSSSSSSASTDNEPVHIRWNVALDDSVSSLLALAVGSDDPDRLREAVLPYLAGGSSLATAYRGSRLVGVLGYENSDGRTLVRHLATESGSRRTGVGRAMMWALVARTPGDAVVAETDGDSVGFYAAIGFEVRSLGEKYPGVERFRVTLPGW